MSMALLIVVLSSTACRFELPLALSPTGALLTRLTISCGSWTSSGAACSARATYSDGSELDVTTRVSWESSDATLAIVDRNGRVAFAGRGKVTVRATFQNVAAPWTPLSTL